MSGILAGGPAGYLALPRASTGPGVLVLHAWWGLSSFFTGLCQRLAAEGLVAFAPDLYGGKVASSIAEAKVLRSKMDRKRAEATLASATTYLRSVSSATSPGLGLLGFSLGAYLGLGLLTSQAEAFRAAVVFYGARNGDYSASRADFLAHFAESDDYVSASGRQGFARALARAGRPLTAYEYPGTAHWFFEGDRPEAFHAAAAALAWERTIDFLHTALETGTARAHVVD